MAGRDRHPFKEHVAKMRVIRRVGPIYMSEAAERLNNEQGTPCQPEKTQSSDINRLEQKTIHPATIVD